jgi:hypothetical protein
MIYPSGLPGLLATYGNPWPYLEDKRAWEDLILATRPLRYPLPYAYDRVIEVKTIRAHKLVVDALVEILAHAIEAGIEPGRISYGGCYVWRAKRGGTRLSTHTWGVAIDLDPARNPLGKAHDPAFGLPMKVVELFEDAGWTAGARWDRPDPMHFQAAESY